MRLVLENMKKSGNPIGLSSDKCSYWAKGLSIPRNSGKILYTSCMYQMAPYIKKLVEQLERFGETSLSSLALGLGRVFSRIIDVTSVLRPPAEELERSSVIIRKIYSVLRRIDPDIGYLYEEEPYSGALLYELGLESAFIDQVERVVEVFKKFGVKKIYTIDPHTYHVLKDIYPRYIDNFDIEVYHYIEVLSEKIDVLEKSGGSEEYVIHDPCLLARYANIINQPRRILDKLGVRYREHIRSKIRTRCCGGPIESIAPSISGYMARYRLEELASVSNRIIVMCPICYVSLSRVADKNHEIRDLAEFLG